MTLILAFHALVGEANQTLTLLVALVQLTEFGRRTWLRRRRAR